MHPASEDALDAMMTGDVLHDILATATGHAGREAGRQAGKEAGHAGRAGQAR